MARPKKSAKFLEISGAFAKDPQRRRAREAELRISAALGPPPVEWTGKDGKSARCNELLEIWHGLVAQDVLGVLNISHRVLMESTCYLFFKIRQAARGIGKATSGDHAQLSSNLAKMGQTPADSARVMDAVRMAGQGGTTVEKKQPGKDWGELVG